MKTGVPLGFVFWRELRSADPAAVAAFYRDVLGWVIHDFDLGLGVPYQVIRQGDDFLGGITARDAFSTAHNGAMSIWSPFFIVADLAEASERAESLGATRTAGPLDIAPLGPFASFNDPQGVQFQLMSLRNGGTPPAHSVPAGYFIGHRVLTTDVRAASEFYRGLVSGQSVPDATGRPGDLAIEYEFGGNTFRSIGIAPKLDDMPAPAWETYVRVADVDAALAAATAHGAESHTGVLPLPIGRSALIVDPGGAYLWLIETA